MKNEQYAVLKAELALPAYSGMTDAQKTDALNDKVVPRFKKVDYADVASYLMLVSKYLGISKSVDASAEEFMLAMNTFKTFDMTNPLVETKINDTLDDLIIDLHITVEDKTAIISLANDPISRAEEIDTLPSTIKEYEVTNAGNYNG